MDWCLSSSAHSFGKSLLVVCTLNHMASFVVVFARGCGIALASVPVCVPVPLPPPLVLAEDEHCQRTTCQACDRDQVSGQVAELVIEDWCGCAPPGPHCPSLLAATRVRDSPARP